MNTDYKVRFDISKAEINMSIWNNEQVIFYEEVTDEVLKVAKEYMEFLK